MSGSPLQSMIRPSSISITPLCEDRGSLNARTRIAICGLSISIGRLGKVGDHGPTRAMHRPSQGVCARRQQFCFGVEVRPCRPAGAVSDETAHLHIDSARPVDSLRLCRRAAGLSFTGSFGSEAPVVPARKGER